MAVKAAEATATSKKALPRWRKHNPSKTSKPGWAKLWNRRKCFYNRLDEGGTEREAAIEKLKELIEEQKAPKRGNPKPFYKRLETALNHFESYWRSGRKQESSTMQEASTDPASAQEGNDESLPS